jgi:Protein of unknown function (DUF1549)/Protein of unknown function (DUF1553)
MPVTSAKNTSGKTVILKRVLTLAVLAGAVFFALAQYGFDFNTSAQRAARKSQATMTAADDCSFLKDPEQFRGVQQRHRIQVSNTTTAISDNLEQGATRVVPAQDIPRNNYIDNILFARMQQDGVQAAPLTSDAEFARRVYLDLTGHIPSEAQAFSFLSDSDPNKRNLLVDSLVASPEYVDKWTMFLNDLYKNTSNSVNITRYRAGRDAFYEYIRNSVAENKSYAQMATEMLTATGDSFIHGETNFILGGNVTGGPAQDIYDGYAVHAATTFLGLSSMDCLLCHDGAGHLDSVNLWGAQVKRAEAWGMSAFFARHARRTEMLAQNYLKYHITENATGEYTINTTQGNRSPRQTPSANKNAAPTYMFGGGGLNQGENRRASFARHLTSDIQFARATVNYIWEELMVEALVSPSNTWDLARVAPNAQMPEGWEMQAANPELLEALAQDFIASGFNLRYLIGTIAKSSAYQISSQYPGEWKLEYVPYYARKFARRMDAEELMDAIVKATGVPPTGNFNGTNYTGYLMVNEQNAAIRTVGWAMQLPETTEPRRNEAGASAFMNSFLRGDRDQKLRTSEASILQALNMMNNGFIMTRISGATNITNIPNTPPITSLVRRLITDASLSNEQILDKLYLNTLSRFPSDEEKNKLMPYFASLGKQGATESIQWVLLNKVDFLYNY